MTIQNGTQIVAEMAGGRPWWSLRANDVKPWLDTLHPSAVEGGIAGIAQIGDGWDGASDIKIGSDILRAPEMTALLAGLRSEISMLGITSLRPPEPSDVRNCHMNRNKMMVIDFDMGDIILPISMGEASFIKEKLPPTRAIVDGMVAVLRHAGRMRTQLVGRDRRMRKALEETTDAIGEGASPFWLRRGAFPFDGDPKYLARCSFTMVMISLNECLVWAPTYGENVDTLKDVRAYKAWISEDHRRRAQMKARLAIIGSRGMIDDVALALIRDHGLDANETFDRALQACLNGRGGVVELMKDGRKEKLLHRDGTMVASFSFGDVHYYGNKLTLSGKFPETMALVSKGRRLDDFVDHPAFRSSAAVVRKAHVDRDVLDLIHTPCLIPIEKVPG